MFFLLAVLVLLLSSLACDININNGQSGDLSIEQTRTALQMTQAVIENTPTTSTGDQAAEPDNPPTNEPQPPEGDEMPDAMFDGIGFSYDPSIASNVSLAVIVGQNMGENAMPGETYPTHHEFTLNNYPVTGSFHSPQILIYPVEDYSAISPYAAEIINQLKQTLIDRPSGRYGNALPFLPLWNAAQIFSAKVAYFNFQNGSGVRYLTTYGQDIYPVNNNHLFYTYQGLTDDGRHYVSAIFPVSHMDLPNEGGEAIDDWQDFEAHWDEYISEGIVWFNEEDPNAFKPSITLLDEIMASLMINR